MGAACSGGSELQKIKASNDDDDEQKFKIDKEKCVYGLGPASSKQCCWDVLNSVPCRFQARDMPCPYSHSLDNAGQPLEVYNRRDMMDKKLEFRTQRALRSIAQQCREHFSQSFAQGFDIFEEMLKLSGPLLLLLRAYNAAEKKLRAQEETDFETLKELGEKKEHWSDAQRDVKGPVLPLQSKQCVSVLDLQRQAKAAQEKLKKMFVPEYPKDATWNGEVVKLIELTKVGQAKKAREQRERLLKEKRDARRKAKGRGPSSPAAKNGGGGFGGVKGVGGKKSAKYVDLEVLRSEAIVWWIDSVYDPGVKSREKCEEKLSIMARVGDGAGGAEEGGEEDLLAKKDEKKMKNKKAADGAELVGEGDAASIEASEATTKKARAKAMGFRGITDASRIALQFCSIDRMLQAKKALETMCDVRHFENRHRRPSLVGYADLRFLIAVEIPRKNAVDLPAETHICEIELQHWEYVKARKAGAHDLRELEKMVMGLCARAFGLKEADAASKKAPKSTRELLAQRKGVKQEVLKIDAGSVRLASNKGEAEKLELSLKKQRLRGLTKEMQSFVLASLHWQGRKKKIRMGKEKKQRRGSEPVVVEGEEGNQELDQEQDTLATSKKKKKKKKKKKQPLADTTNVR
jgi:hypothetical protein